MAPFPPVIQVNMYEIKLNSMKEKKTKNTTALKQQASGCSEMRKAPAKGQKGWCVTPDDSFVTVRCFVMTWGPDILVCCWEIQTRQESAAPERTAACARHSSSTTLVMQTQVSIKHDWSWVGVEAYSLPGADGYKWRKSRTTQRTTLFTSLTYIWTQAINGSRIMGQWSEWF